MKKILVLTLFSVLLLLIPSSANAADMVNLYLFHSENCPHCKDEREFLVELKEKYTWLNVNEYEISDSENQALLKKVSQKLDTQVSGVPFTVVCGQYMTGFPNSASNKSNFEEMLVKFHEGQCNDPLIEIIGKKQDPAKNTSLTPNTVTVPIFGELKAKDLSLPVFTFIIALLDGFNPCAMWVLIFLIGLLVGLKDRFKMWALGGAFILASGFMYFMFLAAWLHLFLFIGLIKWVRIGIGVFALGAGVYYLYDYKINKAGACKVTGGQKKKKVFEQLKNITQNKNFIFALVGIILLAFAVNLVELVCSAGLPAVYTEVLSLTPMPKWQYYLYLIFYIFIFMLDDLIVYIIAMKTLQTIGIGGKYARLSHLIGGVVMLLIGLAMLLRPELLMFG